MKNKFLPYLLGFAALCLSGVSAYFSIFGLSKLFAGAGTIILVMAGVMEVSKIILTVYIHRFWKILPLVFKSYLILAVVALVIITTMGAYGFLSAGFQTSSVKLDMYQSNKKFVEQKIEFFTQEVNTNNRDLDRVSETISELSGVRSVNIQVRDTSVTGGVRNTLSTVDARLAQERLEIERKNRVDLLDTRKELVDSLQTYRQQLLSLENENDFSSEVGPLQFLSDLTGYPMTKIVNIIIIAIILVLDPLAISMILASSIGLVYYPLLVAEHMNPLIPPSPPSFTSNSEEPVPIIEQELQEEEVIKQPVTIPTSPVEIETPPKNEIILEKKETTAQKVTTLEKKEPPKQIKQPPQKQAGALEKYNDILQNLKKNITPLYQ